MGIFKLEKLLYCEVGYSEQIFSEQFTFERIISKKNFIIWTKNDHSIK